MRILKRLIDIYVFGNIHVALATFCLTKITLYTFAVTDIKFALFVFFATMTAYNFIRLYRKASIESWMSRWVRKHQIMLSVFTLLSLFFTIYYGLQLHRNTILAILPFGLCTVFYVIPVYRNKSLRSIPGCKLFLIAFCWASITVLLPVINYELPFSREVLIIFFQRILFVIAITLPFDIRDLDYDAIELRTVPQIVGIDRTKRIGIFILMLFLGLNFLSENPMDYLRTEFVIALLSFFLLVRSTKTQSRYYSAFFVEAIPIIWLVILILS